MSRVHESAELHNYELMQSTAGMHSANLNVLSESFCLHSDSATLNVLSKSFRLHSV